jgi:hypothetical protein
MSVFAVFMDQFLQAVFMKMNGRLTRKLLNYLVIWYTIFSEIHK